MDVEIRTAEGMSGESCVLGPRARHAGPAITVAEGNSGAEAGMVGEQMWKAIQERRGAGATVSGIARELELDRKTVRSVLKSSSWRPYRRRIVGASLLDEHRAWLTERAPQVHYSARILHQELVRERDFAGCYETVKLAVRPLRAAACVAALTQRRFETAPGEQAQCDWGQLTVSLGTVRTKLHVFIMTLGFSRRGFALGFERERMADLLAAHEAAFAHFGGCCEELLYDRMRTVVLGQGSNGVHLNPTFAAFAAHWGFRVRLCQPYRAQTKGKVESGVKYVKRNFAPGRVFADLEDFNAQLASWQGQIADLRIHGTTHQKPIERFAQEAAHLIPTAGQASFLAAMPRERVVAEDWLVSIDGNRYSVPFALIAKSVQVVREGGNWVIRHRGTIVAEHPVMAGRAQLSVRPEHGPGAVARNARKRLGTPTPARTPHATREVEIRDLALYDELCGTGLVEAA